MGKSSSVSWGLWNAAERHPPSHGCLSSSYLCCPWIREKSLFFSCHHALRCIPNTHMHSVHLCVTVCGRQGCTHTDTMSITYHTVTGTESHMHTCAEVIFLRPVSIIVHCASEYPITTWQLHYSPVFNCED